MCSNVAGEDEAVEAVGCPGAGFAACGESLSARILCMCVIQGCDIPDEGRRGCDLSMAEFVYGPVKLPEVIYGYKTKVFEVEIGGF